MGKNITKNPVNTERNCHKNSIMEPSLLANFQGSSVNLILENAFCGWFENVHILNLAASVQDVKEIWHVENTWQEHPN